MQRKNAESHKLNEIQSANAELHKEIREKEKKRETNIKGVPFSRTKYFFKDRQEERKMKIKRWRERIIAQILGMKVVEKRKVGGNVQ